MKTLHIVCSCLKNERDRIALVNIYTKTHRIGSGKIAKRIRMPSVQQDQVRNIWENSCKKNSTFAKLYLSLSFRRDALSQPTWVTREVWDVMLIGNAQRRAFDLLVTAGEKYEALLPSASLSAGLLLTLLTAINATPSSPSSHTLKRCSATALMHRVSRKSLRCAENPWFHAMLVVLHKPVLITSKWAFPLFVFSSFSLRPASNAGALLNRAGNALLTKRSHRRDACSL